MYKTIFLYIDKEGLSEIETRISGDKSGVYAVVQFDPDTQMQIKADALRGFIEKLKAAEAEINGKAQECIEDIRLQRHVSVLSDESIRRLRQNGTAL